MDQGQPVKKEAKEASETAAARLIKVVSDFVLEVHPERRGDLRLTAESRLDRDLGLDSLGRAELLSRLEREFQVSLPENLLSESETVTDLLVGLAKADGVVGFTPDSVTDLSVLAPSRTTPAEAATLLEVLDRHVENHPNRPHILLWDERGDHPEISYRRLADEARAVAGALTAHGVDPGDRIALMLPTGADFFFAFFGILTAGCVPVPIYPPVRPSQLEDHLRRQTGILNNAGAVGLVTVRQARAIAAVLKLQVDTLRFIETVDGLRDQKAERVSARVGANDLALLQYTSGSTGRPKGVMLTHANLLANIRAMGRSVGIDSNDIAVSWLPLYHDMGLIGTWMAALYFAVPSVIMSPLTFLARPEQWLWAIHRHRATVSAAPNFAFELCVRKVEEEAIRDLDLSSLRLMMNGAEPVSAATIRRFTERFEPYGFRADAMAPVYGMAENSLAVTVPFEARSPLVDRVRRDAMTSRGVAVSASAESPEVLEFVACGQPLRGHELRVVDADGHELPDRREGRLQFRGPSATSGYFRNAEATSELLDGDWRNSGDLGYVAEGDVFVTGRSKDIIIRAGRNIYPHQVEEAVGQVEGVRKGCVAVFGTSDAQSGTERLVLVAETRETVPERIEEIRSEVRERSAEVLESAVDEVVLVPPQTVPKTSSGKIRRSETRSLYERGALGAGKRPPWRQLVRFTAEGLTRRVRVGFVRATRLLYGGYTGLVVVLGMIFGLPWVFALPSLKLRWSAGRLLCRTVLGFMGISVRIEGMENMPQRGGVVVSNHASYLDALVLTAVLPAETVFLVKGELRSHWFVGPLLRRLAALFVERIDPGGSVEDSRVAVDRAGVGERLLFFPEGTFWRKPGLLDFRMGAFVTAATAGVAVVPMALRGTRSVLRDGSFLLSRGQVEVRVGEPIPPAGADFDAAIKLRDASRAWILRYCGEPDLTGETAIFHEAGVEELDPTRS